MINQKTLEKAIQKAIDGGWNPRTYFGWGIDPDLTVGTVMSYCDCDWRTDPECVRGFIFNHDFAKSLFGEYSPEEIPIGLPSVGEYPDNLTHRGLRKWQYHLQMMVVVADPIKYLGEHLDG